MHNLGTWREEQLFDWLKSQPFYDDLVLAKGQMSRWDCYAPRKKHRIELKCRRKHYDDILIEKSKYDALIAEASKHGDVPVYINSTPKGVYCFDLRKHDGFWELRRMPKTTEFSERQFIVKEVGYLNIKDAFMLKVS